jgi:hypothetical protein
MTSCIRTKFAVIRNCLFGFLRDASHFHAPFHHVHGGRRAARALPRFQPKQRGNAGRNIFRGPAFKNWDFSISKLWNMNERLKFQVRGEVFNLLNHPNFDVFTMNNDLFSPSNVGTVISTPDVASSNPVLGSGGSRHIQIGAKFIW